MPLEHPIFHCVYDLKERPQIPAIGFAQQMANGEIYSAQGYGTEEVHYRGLFDDNEPMMAFIGHNTDLGDGWEREGEDPWYFKEFSEEESVPTGDQHHFLCDDALIATRYSTFPTRFTPVVYRLLHHTKSHSESRFMTTPTELAVERERETDPLS